MNITSPDNRTKSGIFFRFDRLHNFWLPVVLAWTLVAILLYAAHLQINPYAFWIAPLIGVTFIWMLREKRNLILQFRARSFLLLAAFIFLVSRVSWILIVPTTPVSDFLGYDLLANLFKTGRPFQVSWPYLTYSLGYPLVLGGWYNLVGNSLFLAKVLNLIFGLASLLLVYRLSVRIDQTIGRLTTLFFALWPAEMAFTSVLASEHLALLLVLGSLIFLFAALDQKDISKSNAFLSGVLLGLGFLVRAPVGITLPAGALAFMTCSQSIKSRLSKTALLLAGFSMIYLLFLVGMRWVYQITTLPQGYSTILSGSNFASDGGWNEKDGIRFTSYPNIQEANQYAKQEVIRRITSNPINYFLLMFKKVLRTWGDETYGVMWSKYPLGTPSWPKIIPKLSAFTSLASQYFHIFLLLLAITACYFIITKGCMRIEFSLLIYLLLGDMALHTIFEAQARYHFWLEPCLIMIACVGLKYLIEPATA
jgi:hypothetical protein